MSFIPLMHHLVAELKFDSVCEFGNQTYKGPGTFESTKAYYESLGCKEYMALDVNTEMDAVVADLNYPVNIGRQFDLVTNNGTGEHIFDQKMVFENAHELSRRHIIHCMPLTTWYNHGFYNFNPILFRDVAYANDYKANIFIADRWGRIADIADEDLFANKRMDKLTAAIEKLKEHPPHLVLIVAIYEKQNQHPFYLPCQGNYTKDIADDELKERYAGKS